MKQKPLILLIVYILYTFSIQKMAAQTTAVNDTASVISEIPMPVHVLDNDSYTCASPIITLATPPSYGTAYADGDSVIVYTSGTGYTGEDQLTYTIECNGATSAVATVKIMVADIPDNMVYSECYVLPPQTNWSIKEVTPMSTDSVSLYGNLLVGDLDADETIEIIAQTNRTSDYENKGIIIFNYDGSKLPNQSPLVLKNKFELPVNTNNRGSCAIARYNGQEYILVPGDDGYMYAHDINGDLLWKSDTQFKTNETYKIANVGVADFNNDGIPEVYAGATIYSIIDGKQICKGTDNQGGYIYVITIYSTFAVDIDGDGKLELLAGTQIYDVDIAGETMSLKTGWQLPTAEFNKVMNASIVSKDGLALPADIDGDGKPEVIVISRNTNGVTVIVWKPQPDNKSILVGSYQANNVGAINHSTPMIGNIDDTPTPEIIFNTGQAKMYALHYDGTKPQGDRIAEKWIFDHSDTSGATGTTLFDFNQDGVTEIVYRDEKELHIIDGSGTSADAKSTFGHVFSGTVREYPVIADINGDGDAEIIVTGTTTNTGSTSPIRIFKSGDDSWAPARKVWNQYCYNIVNTNENLTIPRYQVNPAIRLGNRNTPYNAVLAQGTTISQNGESLFLTPNPVPDSIYYTYNPSADVLTVSVKIVNKGEAPLNAPVYASLYDKSYSTHIASGTSATGADADDTTTVTITVNTAGNYMPFDSLAIRVNDNGTNLSVQSECDTTDNSLKTGIVFYRTTYDGNASDGGTVPNDNLYYLTGNGVRIRPAGDMSRTDATFIGWTFATPAPGIVTLAAGVPANLMQPDSVFPNLVSDTTFYAVWAEDKRGATGGPDSVPDYLQKEVFYNKTLAVSGTEPADNNFYNPNDSVEVKGNEGSMALTDATFIGWSFMNQTDTVKSLPNIPSDLIRPGDSFEILQTDTTLYAVWAIDKTGSGGIPDSIPDYLQFEVTYDKTLAATGNVPVDGNRYNSLDSVNVKANEETPQLTLTDATFIGWSFTNQTTPVSTVSAIPADLIQPANSFEIVSDTILYAVWAEDETGPGGIPDSIPDYLQFEVTYDKTLAATGNVPVDANHYNSLDSVNVKANEEMPQLTLTDATFIGWSFTNQTTPASTVSAIPADLIQPANSFEIVSDTILYAVWAEDKTGPGGIPDSIPDYLQFEVIYDGNGHSGGVVPTDINFYNSGNTVTILGNTGILEKTNACFIGWSYAARTLIQTEAAIPADLTQAGDIFTISSDTTLYAVWAKDNSGPGGTPDNVPDYLQVKLTYHQNGTYPDNFCTGSLPSPNPIMHTKNTTATISGNTGGLCRNPAEQLIFAGWSRSNNWEFVEDAHQKPADMVLPGDIIPVAETDINLYLVWAYDRNEDGVPDYNEHNITVTLGHKWPEKEDQGDPSDPGNYPVKPEWKPEYDNTGKDTWYAGCDMSFTMTADHPDPHADRTFTINYLGALTRELVLGTDGNPLPESFILPKGQTTYTIRFSLAEIPAERTGMTGALEAVIAGGGSSISEWVSLYNHPSYNNIFVRPVVKADNTVDFGIAGGSPNLMRSINGHAWVNAYAPLSPMEKLSVYDGVSIWLREPNGCWEKQFFFITYTDLEIQRYVDISSATGVTTNPGAGKHYVKGNSDFSFTASYTDGTPLKVTAKGFYSGKIEEITGKDLNDGTYGYTLYKVLEPWTITFGPEPASEITAEEPVGGLSAWTYKNTLHIRSDARRTAFIYTMSGSLYKRMEMLEGDNIITMNRGIYIVVIDNKRYKVIIR